MPNPDGRKRSAEGPANFKREIEQRHGAESRFYITSRDGKAAEIYPLEEWEKLEERLAKLPTSHPTRKKFLAVTNFYGMEVEMDAQGRLLLPARLREKAGLKGEVSVVGMLTYLEVRNMEAYSQYVDENPITDEDANELSALGF